MWVPGRFCPRRECRSEVGRFRRHSSPLTNDYGHKTAHVSGKVLTAVSRRTENPTMDWDRAELVAALDHLALTLERANTPSHWVSLSKPAQRLIRSDRRRRQWFGSKRYPMIERPGPGHTCGQEIDWVWIWKRVRGRVRKEPYWLLPSALHDEDPIRWEQYRQSRRTMSADQALDTELLLAAQ
jgi:hypothetical protein